MTEDDLRQLYRRWLLELWQGDYAVAPELVGPKLIMHRTRGGGTTEELDGPEGVAQVIRQGMAYFTDVSIGIDVGPLADGDKVAASWTWRGSYQGGVPGATADVGTRVTFNGTDILRAEDGKFVEYWVQTDDLTFMTQLGAV